VTPADYDFLRAFLKQRSGLAITVDKHYLIDSRLMPLARRRGFAELSELVHALRLGRDEALAVEVVEAMTTNETLFFRDRLPFEHFKTFVMPQLLQARSHTRRIRIWCAAAATGQEPYSLAMALKEMGGALDGYRVDILATDLSQAVLSKARAGRYSQFEVQRGLPIQMLLKYFSKSGDHWQIRPDIRSMVAFRPFNLLDDLSPLGLFDFILCRNVLFYFDQATRADLFARLRAVTAPDGYLVLGSAETIMGLTSAFAPVDGRRGLYAPVAVPMPLQGASPRGLPAA